MAAMALHNAAYAGSDDDRRMAESHLIPSHQLYREARGIRLIVVKDEPEAAGRGYRPAGVHQRLVHAKRFLIRHAAEAPGPRQRKHDVEY